MGMTHDEFLNLLNEEFERIKELFENKNKDYARKDEVFNNFNTLAKLIGQKRETVWLIYFMKHVLSIANWVREGAMYTERPEDRLRDIIVYALLLIGMIKEKEKK